MLISWKVVDLTSSDIGIVVLANVRFRWSLIIKRKLPTANKSKGCLALTESGSFTA